MALRKFILAALFAALVLVMSLVVRVPSPMGGYVNLGDVAVLLAGWFLGPWYGPLGAGLGAALADIISGCAFYAPGTLVIKFLVALLAWSIHRGLMKGLPEISWALSALLAEAWMVLGYLFYAGLILGRMETALLCVPGNMIQALVAIVLSSILGPLLYKIPKIREVGSNEK